MASLSLLPLELLEAHFVPFLGPEESHATQQTCRELHTAIQRYRRERARPFVLRERRRAIQMGRNFISQQQINLWGDGDDGLDTMEVYQVEPYQFIVETLEFGQLLVEIKLFRPLWIELYHPSAGNQRGDASPPPQVEFRVKRLIQQQDEDEPSNGGPRLAYRSLSDACIWEYFWSRVTLHGSEPDYAYLDVRRPSEAVQMIELCAHRLTYFHPNLPSPRQILCKGLPKLLVEYLSSSTTGGGAPTHNDDDDWPPVQPQDDLLFPYRPPPKVEFSEEGFTFVHVRGATYREYTIGELPWWYSLAYDSDSGTYDYDDNKCCYRKRRVNQKRNARGKTNKAKKQRTASHS